MSKWFNVVLNGLDFVIRNYLEQFDISAIRSIKSILFNFNRFQLLPLLFISCKLSN